MKENKKELSENEIEKISGGSNIKIYINNNEIPHFPPSHMYYGAPSPRNLLVKYGGVRPLPKHDDMIPPCPKTTEEKDKKPEDLIQE